MIPELSVSCLVGCLGISRKQESTRHIFHRKPNLRFNNKKIFMIIQLIIIAFVWPTNGASVGWN